MKPLTVPSLLLFAAALHFPNHSTRADVDFGRDVLPILSTNCASCHSGVKKTSGFSFSTPKSLFEPAESGAHPIVPGKPEASELISRVSHSNPDERMPPEGDPLDEKEIAILTEWIASGAKWDLHWAFSPRAPGSPPRTKNAAWPVNDIDRYVLRKLETAGIQPSPEADRYTLIRRVALDITGLPPTIAEVDAFVADNSENAYETIVDHYLASPHFGERWARHWLDQARYADSDGYEKDNARGDAWRWRQWVIASINDDQPFDQFTIEQIAGDLIPEAQAEQRLATAFHRQTLFNREGGVDPEEDRTKRVIDRATTTSATWLGLTIQCTQCHDHPYDPITQREFYEFYAFFNNADETTIALPMVGGRPVMSSATRRIRVYRSASGEGWIPAVSSFLRTYRSMSFTGQAAFFVRGGEPGARGENAQCRSHLAPEAIHSVKIAISFSSSGSPSGGMRSSGFEWLTREMSSLASGLPGTIGCAPDSAGSKRLLGVENEKPLVFFTPLWQLAQFVLKIGNTSRPKSTSARVEWFGKCRAAANRSKDGTVSGFIWSAVVAVRIPRFYLRCY